MQNTLGKSMLEANNAFERDCHIRGVEPKSYHVDNNIYSEQMFLFCFFPTEVNPASAVPLLSVYKGNEEAKEPLPGLLVQLEGEGCSNRGRGLLYPITTWEVGHIPSQLVSIMCLWYLLH